MLACFLIFQILNNAFCVRTTQLYGNSSLGYYFLKAYIGNPFQEKLLIVDTGSHLTVFPCKNCTTCKKHSTPLFRTKNSKTFQTITSTKKQYGWSCSTQKDSICTFNQKYIEGSEYSGFFGQDILKLQNEPKSEGSDLTHFIGCATQETGEFYKQKIDGIIGFGVSQQNGLFPPTFVDLEYKKSNIKNNSFSICLSSNGGFLNIGGWNTQFHLKNEPIFSSDCSALDWSEQYHVQLKGMSVY